MVMIHNDGSHYVRRLKGGYTERDGHIYAQMIGGIQPEKYEGHALSDETTHCYETVQVVEHKCRECGKVKHREYRKVKE